MPSRATIRSLLVTPSSFARSMTFTRAATAPLPPPPDFQDHRRALDRAAGSTPRRHVPSRPAGQCLPETRLIAGKHTPRALPPCRSSIHPHPPIRAADQPDERGLARWPAGSRCRSLTGAAVPSLPRRRRRSAAAAPPSTVVRHPRERFPRSATSPLRDSLGTAATAACSATHACAASMSAPPSLAEPGDLGERGQPGAHDARRREEPAVDQLLHAAGGATSGKADRSCRPFGAAPPRRGGAPPRPRPRS